jgi:hypothetical protein
MILKEFKGTYRQRLTMLVGQAQPQRAAKHWPIASKPVVSQRMRQAADRLDNEGF